MAQPVKAGERLSDVVWAPKTSDGSGSSVEHKLEMTTQGSRNSDPGGVPVVQGSQGCSLGLERLGLGFLRLVYIELQHSMLYLYYQN